MSAPSPLSYVSWARSERDYAMSLARALRFIDRDLMRQAVKAARHYNRAARAAARLLEQQT